MSQQQKHYDRQINHKTMRIVIGAIAILLAPVTYLLADVSHPVNSISATYWTNSGDLFVGSLIAVGFFLAAYNGASGHRDAEFYLSKASAVFAVGIALFPTTGSLPQHIEPSWTIAITHAVGLVPMNVHFGCAVLLFVCLIAMLFFFARRAADKGKHNRAALYKIVAWAMVIGIAGVGVIWQFVLGADNAILLVEWVGLTLFGIGWLIAGIYSDQDAQAAKTTP